ncbi:MAG: PilZ domain-containing protein [Pseudomonadota bacterium]
MGVVDKGFAKPGPHGMLQSVPKEQEKRRVGPRARVEVDIDLSAFGHYDLSKLTNVSIGGAFIRTTAVQPIGTRIGMTFHLPGDSEAIRAEGEVVWVYNQPGKGRMNMTGMGLRFVEIDSNHREKIRKFVEDATIDELIS